MAPCAVPRSCWPCSSSAAPSPRPGWLQIQLHDTGPGIAPEHLEQIFEPLTQGNDSITRTHGGMGMGLALARRAAHRLGGELRCTSTLGEGSTFSLHLPLEASRTPTFVDRVHRD